MLDSEVLMIIFIAAPCILKFTYVVHALHTTHMPLYDTLPHHLIYITT